MNQHASDRRGFLRSACRHCLGLGALVGGGAIAQDLSAIKVPPRFARPAADTTCCAPTSWSGCGATASW